MSLEKLTDKQIWNKAYKGDPSILSDPRVSTLRDKYGRTSLHYLAHKGVKEVWSHSNFDKVKDKNGETPKDWWFVHNRKPPACADFVK